MDEYLREILRIVGYLAIGVVIGCLLVGIFALLIGGIIYG